MLATDPTASECGCRTGSPKTFTVQAKKRRLKSTRTEELSNTRQHKKNSVSRDAGVVAASLQRHAGRLASPNCSSQTHYFVCSPPMHLRVAGSKMTACSGGQAPLLLFSWDVRVQRPAAYAISSTRKKENPVALWVSPPGSVVAIDHAPSTPRLPLGC
ncbi:hypothetical protein VTN77DRAFT_2485 [Rasamsonia byssochlamydoides]|uniref:uncharacterized protein n=1 Tax=Rasamsonia byssochlamydoides TaxID=89139 RepID=UPI0037424F9E